MAHWLVKTEPSECGIDDFAKDPGKPIPWDGVRNYQARNFLTQMREGDQVLIYHSSCKHIGVTGIVQVVREAYPDAAQFDERSPYFDPKSTREKPRWQAVDFQFVKKLPALIPLDHLKNNPDLSELALVKRGSRLSVMPVTPEQWESVLRSV